MNQVLSAQVEVIGFIRLLKITWKQKLITLAKYRLDSILSLLLNFALPLALKIILFTIYSKFGGLNADIKEILSYYLVSQVFWGLFLADAQMTGYAEKFIKSGQMNYMLIKPIPILRYLYLTTMANSAIGQIFGLMTATIGLLISRNTLGSINVPIFALAFINAAILCLAFNVVFSALSLKMTQAKQFRNTALHFVELLRGETFPLYVFPIAFQKIILLLPPASTMYIPILLALGKPIESKYVYIGSIWAVLLMSLALKFWKSNLQSFDGALA
jgi:ABC-type uncharacterized transport system permease subunit